MGEVDSGGNNEYKAMCDVDTGNVFNHANMKGMTCQKTQV